MDQTIGCYVHVPFCAAKCGYCDFHSVVAGPVEMAGVIDAMRLELDRQIGQPRLSVQTVFIGGGTPTVLPPELLADLLKHIRSVLIQEPAEFTVEANPASLDPGKAALLRGAGVNRISLGAQSFQDYELKILGRIHSADDIADTVRLVQRAGFEHLNLDLIFGIPGQDLLSWKESLHRAIELGVDHISCYSLTYEPGTPMYRRLHSGEIQSLTEDEDTELYLAAIDTLVAAGFEHYEISNFARPSCECRHNLGYWHAQGGVGIGPAAASYMGGRRWRNIPDLKQYCEHIQAGQSPVESEEMLEQYGRAGELAMLQLRLIRGLDCRFFQEVTGLDPHDLFADAITRYVAAGMLTADQHHIALTRQGLLLADSIMADFLQPSGV